MSQADIALFLPSLRGGGAERVMVNLARGFVERGLQVDLVLAKAEGPYLAQVTKGVRVIDLNSRRVLYSLPGLVRYLRHERPRVMLSTMAHANIVALWARKMAYISTRMAIREAVTVSINANHAHSLRGRWLPLLMRRFYPWADVIIANSRESAKDLARITKLPYRIKVIYNPVITSELFSKAKEAVNHLWFKERVPVVLGVGRLTAQKDFSTLIRAFSLVRKESPVRLMILGEGEERTQLEALIHALGLEQDIVLPGFVDNPFKYMKRAAVFVLSSRWEGLPNALIEALALGASVVSTDCPSGPREILENGRCGRLVPVGAVEELARAILAQLKAPLPPCPLEALKAKYGVKEVVDQYLNVLGISD